MTCNYRILIAALFLFSCSYKTERSMEFQSQKEFLYKNLFKIHKKLPLPQAGDWRDINPEIKQSIKMYVESIKPRSKDNGNVLYLQPIGLFNSLEQREIDLTARYISVFFGTKCRLMEYVSEDIIPDSARRFHLHTEQLQSSHILYEILNKNVPQDGIAMFGITKKDLYPKKGWNFVFGQASLSKNVGIASVFRLQSEHNPILFRKRLLKTVSHEICHIFQLKHCQEYYCLMNGSNDLEEADKILLWLCPICNCKLKWYLDYDTRNRFSNLRDFYKEFGLEKEAKFMNRSLDIGWN